MAYAVFDVKQDEIEDVFGQEQSQIETVKITRGVK